MYEVVTSSKDHKAIVVVAVVVVVAIVVDYHHVAHTSPSYRGLLRPFAFVLLLLSLGLPPSVVLLTPIKRSTVHSSLSIC